MRGSITRRGKASWRLRFDVGDDPLTGKRKVSSVTVRGKRSDAEARLRSLLGTVDDGTFIDRSAKVTVAEFVRGRVKQWFESGAITLRTRERYDMAIDHQIAPHLGTRIVQTLRTTDIEAWHSKLRTEGRRDGAGGLSSGTIRAAHQIMQKALRDGVKHGIVARNVCSGEGGERAPKSTKAEMEILKDDEVASVVEKLRGRAIFPKVVISLFMGLRRGEVLALRWSCINFATKTLSVREAVEETKGAGLRIKPPKTAAGVRDLVMPTVVIDALQEHWRETLELHLALGLGRPAGDALVFARLLDRGCQSPNVYTGDWRSAVLALKLPDVSLHALRHSHASMLISANVDIVEVSRRLGHADPSVTLRTYAHLYRRDDSRSADAINAMLGPLGKRS